MARVFAVNVQKYIQNLDYPATRDDILRVAKKAGADEELREALKKLPRADFETPDDVSKALGKTRH